MSRIITACLTLFSTASGGRTEFMRSGYRSLIRFEGGDANYGFELIIDNGENHRGIAPGSVGNGRLSFWAANELPTLLTGQRFEILEGSRVVGQGSILNPGTE